MPGYTVRGMGALKPWHIAVTTICCLLPLAAAILGTVWAIRVRR